MHQTRRATLQDVADRAGVSLTTASRVVNEGSRRVGPRLADRVKAAAAELGYTANLQARAVATGQSTMVGVVVHDISDPYFSSIAAGLIEVADARGLLVCISSAAAASCSMTANNRAALKLRSAVSTLPFREKCKRGNPLSSKVDTGVPSATASADLCSQAA